MLSFLLDDKPDTDIKSPWDIEEGMPALFYESGDKTHVVCIRTDMGNIVELDPTYDIGGGVYVWTEYNYNFENYTFIRYLTTNDKIIMTGKVVAND